MKKPMDEWVSTALTDDQMVVELLLRIKHAGTVESENPTANQPLLRWGFRQRRSRPSRLGPGVGGCFKKEMDSARGSPITPLCWSGGSGSGGSTCPSAATADGFEDTSHQASSSTSTGSRSKALNATNEIDISYSNRSKKKKTYCELQDVENLQMKENFDLDKIASMQSTYEKPSLKNQSLERIKLEYSDRIKTDRSSKRRSLISPIKNKRHVVTEFCRATSETKSSEENGFFFLPDLNMTPTEEDETLYGTS